MIIVARKKRKKKRRLKIKNILIFLFVILIFFVFLSFIIIITIKNIYITGNEILTDEIIMEESHLDSYPSFLLTPSSKIISSLHKNKYIDKVKIRKKLGNIVEIVVYEYRAIALLDNGNKVIISNGDIIDNEYNIVDIAVLNNDIPNEVRGEFAKKFNKVNRNILRQISQIEYSPVKVDDERFLLYMDDGNIVYVTLTKISKLNKYNKIKGKLGGKTGIIYLDFGDYVELKDNKAIIKNIEEKKE